MQRETHKFPFAATGTSLDNLVQCDGYISDYILTCPNFTNTVTTTLSVLDDSGTPITVWTGDAKAKNNSYPISSLAVPVCRGFTLRATLSGVAGGSGGTCIAQIFVKTNQ